MVLQAKGWVWVKGKQVKAMAFGAQSMQALTFRHAKHESHSLAAGLSA